MRDESATPATLRNLQVERLSRVCILLRSHDADLTMAQIADWSDPDDIRWAAEK